MESRRYVALSSVGLALLLGCLTLVGCGGSPNAGTFQVGPEDAGSPGPAEDASLLPADAGSLLGDANEPPCPPAPVPSFSPTWKPPSASKSGACTTVQISTFFDACLGASSSTAGCAAFTQSNATCSSCLQSDDTDAQYGPVIWHSNRTYYTTNIAGCIADEEPDAGVNGCGPAYEAVIECKETACSACLSAQDPDFSRYATCEDQAGTECETFIQTLTNTCGTTLKDPTSPIAVCIPPSGDTAEDAYLRLAPVFCGQ